MDLMHFAGGDICLARYGWMFGSSLSLSFSFSNLYGPDDPREKSTVLFLQEFCSAFLYALP